MVSKRGGYAEQSIIAARIADEMQAQAVAYIAEQYANPPDEQDFDITNMTLNDLVDMVERASSDGSLDKMNTMLAGQIAQIILSGGKQEQVEQR